MLAIAIPAHKTLSVILSSSVYVHNGINENLAPSQINSFVCLSNKIHLAKMFVGYRPS